MLAHLVAAVVEDVFELIHLAPGESDLAAVDDLASDVLLAVMGLVPVLNELARMVAEDHDALMMAVGRA